MPFLTMLTKFGSGASTLTTYSASFGDDQIFPFRHRAQAISICNIVARTCTVFAPQVNEFSAPIPILFFIGSVSVALFVSFTFGSPQTPEEDPVILDVEDIEGILKKTNSTEDKTEGPIVNASPTKKKENNDIVSLKHAYNKERRGSTAQSFIYYQGIVKTKAAKAHDPPKSLKERFKNQFEDVESSISESGSSSDLLTSSEESANQLKEKSVFGNY